MWTDDIRNAKIKGRSNGYENIDPNILNEIEGSKIARGHNFTLAKKQSGVHVRKYSFSQRTINIWNKNIN